MKCFKYTYRLLAALTLLMNLAACTQDESFLSPDGQGAEEGQTKLLLSITMPAADTRATATTSLAGTAAENKLNRVTIFLADKQGNIQEYTREGENLQTPLVYLLANGGDEMEIYVAANMTDAQISAIKKYKNPALEISNINEITGVANGFLMTAQATDGNGKQKINITPGEMTSIKANLNRVVSKVLLTCTTEKEGYAKLAAGSKGYIKLTDVHYALTTTNKKFFPFAKANNEDPNYSLSDFLNMPGDFFAYTGNVYESTNVAIKYDASRMNSSSQNPPYNEGIYCLENTVKVDKDYGLDISVPKKVATYVKIAAKFTPMCIDNKAELSEKQAINKLEGNGGTFYACRKAPEGYKHICYSTAAKGVEFLEREGFSNITANDFIEHVGGWQEYETFVASPSEFTADSNLKRNNYYIINVTAINAPIQEKTIEVNTTVAEWIVKGKTTIEIETNN